MAHCCKIETQARKTDALGLGLDNCHGILRGQSTMIERGSAAHYTVPDEFDSTAPVNWPEVGNCSVDTKGNG